jgi:hypothetical protein
MKRAQPRGRARSSKMALERQDVRQTARRVNVPRQSQRPAERSGQRRSRRP